MGHVFLTCSTVDELRFNLDIAKQIKGGILYLAFHGNPKIIVMLLELDVEIETSSFSHGETL